jgi:phosphoglycolate phosphatase
VLHRFQLIVFDYDGTLVDSQHAILRGMIESFTAQGLVPPDAAAVRQVIGLSLESAVARLLPDPRDTGLVARVAEKYRQAFLALRSAADYHEPLFPGVRETLVSLDKNGVRLGIATGKARRGLNASLERHQLGQHFATLQTVDSAPGKPDPEMLYLAMAEAGTAPGETVMIGDTSYDMTMAANAGVAAVGVSWGYHDPEELRRCGAAAIADDFASLPVTLSGLSGGGA